MAVEVECCECGRLVPEGEAAEGDDGRLLCCCCRLQESGEELAEDERRPCRPDQDRVAAESTSKASYEPPRSLAPPEPDPPNWAGAY